MVEYLVDSDNILSGETYRMALSGTIQGFLESRL